MGQVGITNPFPRGTPEEYSFPTSYPVGVGAFGSDWGDALLNTLAQAIDGKPLPVNQNPAPATPWMVSSTGYANPKYQTQSWSSQGNGWAASLARAFNLNGLGAFGDCDQMLNDPNVSSKAYIAAGCDHSTLPARGGRSKFQNKTEILSELTTHLEASPFGVPNWVLYSGAGILTVMIFGGRK